MNSPHRTPTRSVFRRFVLSTCLIVALSLFTAQACGPFFFPDVFVLKLRPDKPKEFAAGSLGVLLPTYPRQDLAVAFRYLNGGTLSAAEQAAYEPSYSMNDPDWEKHWNQQAAGQKKSYPSPMDTWIASRSNYGPPAFVAQQKNSQLPDRLDGSDYYGLMPPHCYGDAFRVATATLNARAKTWGDKSPDLVDWLKGQDAVFANCIEGNTFMPPSPHDGASTLLKADRAYQIAAAQFYAKKLDDARKGFEAIGQDAQSPWRGIARFVAARCIVQQAFNAGPKNDAALISIFDPKLMRQAADRLNSLLKENPPGISHHAIQNELDFVRIRIEPDARLRELSSAIEGPNPDPDYRQHLTDLTWYLDSNLDELAIREDFQDDYNTDPTTKDFSKPYADLAKLRSDSTLIDWLITFQSPATEAKDHAIAEWQKTHTAYWLLAAISKATAQDTATPDLIAAAAEFKSDTPAAESFTYHRIRLLITAGKTVEARALLNQSLPLVRKAGRDSSINFYLGLQAHASASLAEFLANAPRKVISPSSESQASLDECLDVMKNPKRVYDCAEKAEPVQFSQDATTFFNEHAPLSVLIESANSSALPQQLRQAIAEMAWVRAVLLNDDASAAKLDPLLPEKLVQEAGPGTGFHPLMTLLRNPGLRPYLDPGVQRSYSYDFVESYRDNWWTADWLGSDYRSTVATRRPEPVSFLTRDQTAQAQKELDQLLKLGPADTHLGQLTLDYANAHPNDPDVAESLYLVLRMIRYSSSSYGYSDDSPVRKEYLAQVDTIRKSAARLLRQRYVTSPWTKQAAPYVGGQ
jgi:hypothetical protein